MKTKPILDVQVFHFSDTSNKVHNVDPRSWPMVAILVLGEATQEIFGE